MNKKEQAKNLIKDLKNLDGVYNFQKVVDIFQDKKYEDIYQELDIWSIVYEQGIETYDAIEDAMRENDLTRNIYFLGGIERGDDDYYYIDGYGNARNLTYEDISRCVEEIINRLEDFINNN